MTHSDKRSLTENVVTVFQATPRKTDNVLRKDALPTVIITLTLKQ